VRAPAAPDALLAAARSGDRVALARLLTIVENDPARTRELAPATWAAAAGEFSLGITGSPGAGKSTLTDRLISRALERFVPDAGSAPVSLIGVLCVDPTSPFSGGAILGDRVRMQDHALDDRVFIRSLATRGHHGGLSIAVPDALAAMSAAGVGLVVVETVGVGQVELDVASTTTMTAVVVTPGWGDAMQAAKAGILEIADLFVVNKADRPGSTDTRRDLDQMLDLGTGRADGWRPPIVETVATEGTGIDDVLDAVDAFRAHLRGPAGEQRRLARSASVLRRIAAAGFARRVEELASTAAFHDAAVAVARGVTDPYTAAADLLGA